MKIAHSNSLSLTNWINDLQEFQLDNIFDTAVLARAYDYISRVSKISIQEHVVTCQLDGTTLYDTKIEMVGSNINGFCNCPHDQACKHLAATILSLMNIDWDSI